MQTLMVVRIPWAEGWGKEGSSGPDEESRCAKWICDSCRLAQSSAQPPEEEEEEQEQEGEQRWGIHHSQFSV